MRKQNKSWKIKYFYLFCRSHVQSVSSLLFRVSLCGHKPLWEISETAVDKGVKRDIVSSSTYYFFSSSPQNQTHTFCHIVQCHLKTRFDGACFFSASLLFPISRRSPLMVANMMALDCCSTLKSPVLCEIHSNWKCKGARQNRKLFSLLLTKIENLMSDLVSARLIDTLGWGR